MALAGESTGTIKEKISFIGLKLKDTLKRLSIIIRIELQAAISRIRLTLSAMIVRHYGMSRPGERGCTIAWQTFVIVCRRRPIR